MIKNTTLSLFAVVALWLFAAVSFADVVNINKADAAAFQQHLTGIGPVKAKAIVSYRSKNGPFEHIDDLKNVSGIGEELLKANRKSLS
ncbi:MAG: helix-hairpin-helix domain-containing protein, partial [Gammaproteobacteria bacterium]|nr:helix-hairpin-helix domain-containing protein [Gammaproteobacteria bacterium]